MAGLQRRKRDADNGGSSRRTHRRASHAIFVREGAEQTYEGRDVVPDVLRRRTLSLRAYDAADMMSAARLVEGGDAADAIAAMFADPAARNIHAHYATGGCYAARIDRDGD